MTKWEPKGRRRRRKPRKKWINYLQEDMSLVRRALKINIGRGIGSERNE